MLKLSRRHALKRKVYAAARHKESLYSEAARGLNASTLLHSH